MSQIQFPNLLLQLDVPPLGSCRCEAWEKVPTAWPVQIAVACDNNAPLDVVDRCRRLFDALERALRNMGGRLANAPCGGYGYPPHACRAWDTSNHRHILVYFGPSSGLHPAYTGRFLDPAQRHQTSIIPVLEPGQDPGRDLPRELRGFEVAQMDADPHSIIPDILSKAGYAPRLFISYRQSEAREVADQLFDAFTHARFDVFLDRFSEQSGDDFMERIEEELVDKGFVLLLNTTNITQSKYVVGEVAMAMRYNLGLAAIDLPGSTYPFPGIWNRKDLNGVSLSGGKLGPTDVAAVVEFVKGIFCSEMSRRPRRQARMIRHGAKAAGLAVVPLHGRGVELHSKQPAVYHCQAEPGLIGTDAFMALDSMGARANRLLLGPVAVHGAQSRLRCDWLAGLTSTHVADEGLTWQVMRRIATGKPL